MASAMTGVPPQPKLRPTYVLPRARIATAHAVAAIAVSGRLKPAPTSVRAVRRRRLIALRAPDAGRHGECDDGRTAATEVAAYVRLAEGAHRDGSRRRRYRGLGPAQAGPHECAGRATSTPDRAQSAGRGPAWRVR